MMIDQMAKAFIFIQGYLSLTIVSYAAEPVISMQPLCERSSPRTLRCQADFGPFMNITSAMYGRLRTDICPTGFVTNCRSPLSLPVVAKNCHGLSVCTVTASNQEFGDPCIGTLKYLQINYTCLHGHSFPSFPKMADGYLFSNQRPSDFVMRIAPNHSDLPNVTQPLWYTIYEIIESNYNAEIDEDSYDKAVEFLSRKVAVRTEDVSNYLCSPSVRDFGSQFCVYTKLGYIFTANTFIPGMYVGKSYDLGIVVRDFSHPMPIVRRSRLSIQVVAECFPFPILYNKMLSRCPSSNPTKFAFPSSIPWANSLYGRQFPIKITSASIVSRVFFDADLLVGFQRSQGLSYEVKFDINGTVIKRKFLHVNSYTSIRIAQVTGAKFNVTLDPPIDMNGETKFVNVSMKLIEHNKEITFNTQNAVHLYGTPRITICPDSFCMDSFRKWQKGVEKIKYTSSRDCINDSKLHEVYLRPCNSAPCSRSFDVPISAPAGAIIYHFRNQGLFTRFLPSLYRIILYEYSGDSFPGYSPKYFCDPQPFQDSRRFICLNRYAGRLRVRSNPYDFPTLAVGTVFTIEVQAEGTANGTLLLDRCTFDIRIAVSSSPTPTLTTSTTPVSTILTSTTAKTRPSSTPSSTPSTNTPPYEKPVFNESLKVEIPKDVRFSKSVNMTCNRSTQRSSIIKWYKDGILLAQTGPFLLIRMTNTKDQGYYQCSADYNGVTSYSDKSLLFLSDIFTSSVYLGIANRDFTTDLEDPKSSAYRTLSDELIKKIKVIVSDMPSSSNHEVQIEKFSKGSIVAQIMITSQQLSDAGSMTSYYNQLNTKLLTAAETNGFGSFLVLPSSIIILNKVYCLPEVTGSDSKGPFNWPITRAGNNATIPCPHGPSSAVATRQCAGDFTRGVFWNSVEDSKCNFNNKRTNELNKLSEVQINDTNAESISSDLDKLTENSTQLTTDDTLLASTTFQNLAASNATSDKVVNDMLKVASNLLQANTSTLASSQTEGKALSIIVKGIETLADKIKLPNKTGVPVVKVSNGVAIQAIKLDAKSKASLSFALKGASISNKSVLSNQPYSSNEVEVGLELPETLTSDVKQLSGESRISFVAYGSNQFFQSTKKNALGKRVIDYSTKSNSLVISAHVKGAGRVSLSKPLTGTFMKQDKSKKSLCVFWDFKANDGFGGWSSEGCREERTIGSRIECKCDHMTNFAIVFDVYAGESTQQDATHEKVLGIISYIGIGLSLGGLTITLLSLFLFRRLRRTLPSKILIQLSLSLFLTLICFVSGADRTESLYVCRAFAIAIQYFLLACFCWMSVEALNLYLSFVVVMGSYISRFILKAAIYAWGLPAVIVVVTASLRIGDYGNEKYCIVSGLAAYLTMFSPICLVILINIIVFARVFWALRSSAKGKKVTKDQRRSGISQLRIAASFSAILGLTWVFGIFAIGDGRLFFQYLFCIFNSLQGFIVFYLHVARHEDARNHWLNLISGKGLNYHRPTITSTSQRTWRPSKSKTYRLNSSSSDGKSSTLTSTLGRSSVINDYEIKSSEA